VTGRSLSVLVDLDEENVAAWAVAEGIDFASAADLVGPPPGVQALIEEEIAEKNRQFASYESVKKVTIVPEFTIENGLLTPTLKIKKNQVAERYAAAIEGMYPKD